MLTFDDEADAISLANDTAYAGCRIDLDRPVRALQVAQAVESGSLSVARARRCASTPVWRTSSPVWAASWGGRLAAVPEAKMIHHRQEET